MESAISSLPFLWQGLIVTIEVSFLVVLISLVLGLVLGVGITFGPRWLYWPIRLYSDFIRGIPVLVLIFFVYYGLPALGMNLDNFTAAVAALTMFKTSHVIEIVRGSI
ncbi:MAG: ABC transporter permease subunit, partial [Geminicoccaceae bacterium]